MQDWHWACKKMGSAEAERTLPVTTNANQTTKACRAVAHRLHSPFQRNRRDEMTTEERKWISQQRVKEMEKNHHTHHRMGVRMDSTRIPERSYIMVNKSMGKKQSMYSIVLSLTKYSNLPLNYSFTLLLIFLFTHSSAGNFASDAPWCALLAKLYLTFPSHIYLIA